MKKSGVCLRNNFYFLSKVFRIAPLYIIIYTSLRIMMGIRTSFMSVYFLSYIIACVETGRSLSFVLLFILVSFLLVSISYVAQAIFDNVYKPIWIKKIVQSLQHTVFDQARLTDLEIYDTEEHYTSIVLANNESCSRVLAVIENILNLLESIVTIIVIIGYCLSIDLIVPIVAILSFSISFVMNRHIARLRVDYDNDLQKLNKEQSMLHRILYLPEYAKDIRLTFVRDSILRLYKKTNELKAVIIHNKGRTISYLSAFETILSAAVCIDFLVPLYLVYRILIQKTLMASQFVGILNGCSQLQLKLENLAREIGVFCQNGEMIERYRRVEFRANKIESRFDEESKTAHHPFQKLELNKVCFHYASSDFGLKNIDLTINKGEKIAIVGPNGSGKTSLIKLILRFYDCQSGSIHYNGIPIQQFNTNEYRQAFSTLFQDFCIYALTMEKNIAMDQQVDKTKAHNAIIRVGLEEMLPYMQTVLTQELDENGLSFSGGQLQRLALSRVLYEDRDILIMDEPTSAMDVVFENQFYDMILHQLKDKTIIFVSHRLTSAMICDRILYMENGQILENGSHAELMKLGGGYAKLFRIQTEAFTETP